MEQYLFERPDRSLSGWTRSAVAGLITPPPLVDALNYILQKERRKSVEEIREKIENYYKNHTKGFGFCDAESFNFAFPTLQSFMDRVIPKFESSEYVRKTDGFYEWVE